MPITFVEKGTSYVIKKLLGKDETKRFLESLGFNVGAVITVINELGGNMIINVKETRIAIDKEMAKRIIV